MATKGVCSRKEADEFIVQRKVKINGKLAVLGAKVNEKDEVVVAEINKKLVYLAFNKPKGIITHSPQGEEKSIADILNYSVPVFPVGRLDKDSSGLILLTNDGRLTDRLLNPKHEHEKEYIVKTKKPVDGLFLKKMGEGVKLDDGYVTKKCQVVKIARDRFSIVLTEGKKHQIRRMCAALGYTIADLKRVRILGLKLYSLPEGGYRELKGKELKDFLAKLGL